MYVPTFNAMTDRAEAEAFVRGHHVGQIITVGPDGRPDATLLPVLWEGDRLIAHMARANAHWERIVDDTPALVVVSGPDAYISPSYYATKREHGRVVPTWNYSAVHLSGTIRVIDDPAWVREAVTQLTNHHEGTRENPWQVSDAPDKFVAGRLKAIIGLEMVVTDVEGKVKLSQNRSDADREGAVAGLRADGDHTAYEVADEMARTLEPPLS